VGYLLQKAYLHIYRATSPDLEQELLFLHCDPDEPTTAPHYRYKVAPLVHFEVAGDPWRRVHIPLCDGHQKEVLSSVEALDRAIALAVDFIADEFLPLRNTVP
jgi:hypothetical protein